MSTLEAALNAAERGWRVFPCQPGGKQPGVKDRWEARACADPAVIREHWPRRANVGVACGPSGLVVVDCDQAKEGQAPPPEWAEPGVGGGLDALALLAERLGETLPLDTYQVRTPSGGWHFYFLAPEGSTVRNSASKLAWKVDVRANGGYVVGAGSATPQGAYEAVCEGAVEPLPAWLLRALTETPKPAAAAAAARPVRQRRRERRGDGEGSKEAYRFAALEHSLERLLLTAEGGRNDALNREAYGLVKAGWSAFEVEPILLDAAGRIGLPEPEARRTLASAFSGQ